jgi:hypothetical protein
VISDSFHGLNLLIKYNHLNGFNAALFKSSLRNRYEFDELILDNIEFNSNMEANLIRLNNEGDAYIANKLENGTSYTVSSSSPSLRLPDGDLSLNLHDQFYYLHTKTENKLDDPKFPEFIIANGTFLSFAFSLSV